VKVQKITLPIEDQFMMVVKGANLAVILEEDLTIDFEA
jgi:hypothetical protein